ncbi:type II secretion system protein J [Aliivibrio fischeri]|uniref:PulJ/GspJ family protein n=1 Tax=Aliivibrio fischeri TaxID=668 RepID=UPI00080E0BC0|nr:type II secretion system protein [Aliivibrio fischeri]OCH36992.1 MSHA biogenesis protein MshO [Aliivibrio fischeri]
MKRALGFTLIELILTIVVVGLVALAASNTLQLGFQSYNDSIDRQDNQMQAKFLIEKLSRELRHAVPNSVEVTSNNQCISFVPIESSAFYLSFPLINQKTIDVVLLSEVPLNTNNLRLIINPSTQDDLLQEENHRYVTVDSIGVSGGVSTVAFSSNNNPAFISNSVSERAFFYHPNPIEYCIVGDGVFRSNTQLINQVHNGHFSFENASIQRNSIIKLVLAFKNDLGEMTQYQHDVQVINVP